MFRFPWISEPVGAGTGVGKGADITTTKQRPVPSVGVPMRNKLKRKRVNGDGPSAPRSRPFLPSKQEVNSADKEPPDNINGVGAVTIEPQAIQHGLLKSPPPAEPFSESQSPAHGMRTGHMEGNSEVTGMFDQKDEEL